MSYPKCRSVEVSKTRVDTTKRLMSYPKCRSVEVINNQARPGSNHWEVNYINYKQQQQQQQQEVKEDFEIVRLM
jgi:hypothetical protein